MNTQTGYRGKAGYGRYALMLLAADAAFYQVEDESEAYILLLDPRDGRWHCDCGPDREQPCPHVCALYAYLKGL